MLRNFIARMCYKICGNGYAIPYAVQFCERARSSFGKVQ